MDVSVPLYIYANRPASNREAAIGDGREPIIERNAAIVSEACYQTTDLSGHRAAMIVFKVAKRFGCAFAEDHDLKTFSSWHVGLMDKACLRRRRFQIRGIATRKQSYLLRGPWGWGQFAKHVEQETCIKAVTEGALAFVIADSGVAQYLTRLAHAHNPQVRGSKLCCAISSALTMSICLRRGCEHSCADEGPPGYTAHDQTRKSLLWDLHPRPPAH